MSTYPTGTVALATVRGVENVQVMRNDECEWYSPDFVNGYRVHPLIMVTVTEILYTPPPPPPMPEPTDPAVRIRTRFRPNGPVQLWAKVGDQWVTSGGESFDFWTVFRDWGWSEFEIVSGDV